MWSKIGAPWRGRARPPLGETAADEASAQSASALSERGAKTIPDDGVRTRAGFSQPIGGRRGVGPHPGRYAPLDERPEADRSRARYRSGINRPTVTRDDVGTAARGAFRAAAPVCSAMKAARTGPDRSAACIPARARTRSRRADGRRRSAGYAMRWHR